MSFLVIVLAVMVAIILAPIVIEVLAVVVTLPFVIWEDLNNDWIHGRKK